MSNYMHLVGSEEVSRAASSMREAAHEIQHAASAIDTALHQHRVFLEQWLAEFREVVQATQKEPGDE